MSRDCRCFGCGELNECTLWDISAISKHNKKYYCQDCSFDLFVEEEE